MSEIASTLPVLKERAERFFRRDRLRSIELHTRALLPLSRFGRVFVIGGAIRDLAFFGAENRPISDIDLVVTGRASHIDKYAEEAGAIQNRFGGYQLKSGGFKIDFWPMSRTWAKTAGHIRVRRPEDLLKCTFFDWDAILFEPASGKLIADIGYLNTLRSRRIEINLKPNPSELGSLVRTLRRIALYDARPGPKLKRFIEETVVKYHWKEIVSAEQGAFHVHFLTGYSNYEEFYISAFESMTLAHIGTHSNRQLELDMFSD